MTRAFLEAHPDLVAHLDPDADRVCPVVVHGPHRVSYWCEWLARWQVRGHPAQCGQHAVRTLRRELQDRTDAGGGSA